MTGDRAVSTTVGYVITLSITTLLVSGLLIAGGDFVQDQRQAASQSELRVVGQQLATDIAAADRLAQTSGPDGDLVLRRELPENIAGSNYRIHTSQIGDRDTYQIRMAATNPDVSTDVRVYSTTPVFMKTNLTGGSMAVEYNSVTETLLVKRPGPYVFQEENDRIVIEAESYPEDRVGSGEWNTHYWKSFEMANASGDEALVTYPNESTSGGAGDTTDGPRLDYEVNFEEATTYYVWVRLRAPPGSGGTDDPNSPGNSDSVHAGLEGSPQSYDAEGMSPGTDSNWHWVNVADGDVTVTPSSAGVHTFSIWMREDGTQIDKIVLTKNSSPTFDTGSDDDDTGPPESEWG